MSQPIFIKHLDYYIPPSKLYFKDELDTIEDGDSGFKNSEEFMKFAKTYFKIDSVNVEQAKTLKQMVVGLLEKNVDDPAKANIPKVKYILLALTDDSLGLPGFGHFLQYNFKIVNANTFGMTGNYCANSDYALGIATDLLKNETEEAEVIIITGHKLGETLLERIVGGYGVMGDGVGLAVLSNRPGNAIAKMAGQGIISKGELHDVESSSKKDNTILHYQSYIECVKKAFQDSSLAPSDVKKVILHNANQVITEQAVKGCGIKMTLVDKQNQEKYGHIGTTDIILNLKSCLENQVEADDHILSISNGINGSYVASLFQKC